MEVWRERKRKSLPFSSFQADFCSSSGPVADVEMFKWANAITIYLSSLCHREARVERWLNIFYGKGLKNPFKSGKTAGKGINVAGRDRAPNGRQIFPAP